MSERESSGRLSSISGHLTRLWEDLERDCREDVRKAGPYCSGLSDADVCRLCAFILNSIIQAATEGGMDFFDRPAPGERRGPETLIPHEEMLYCIRAVHGRMRERLLEDAPLTDVLRNRVDKLNEAVDTFRTVFFVRSWAKQEQRFRVIFEQSFAGMALLDPEGRVALANPALCELLEYPKDVLSRELHNVGELFLSSGDRESFCNGLVGPEAGSLASTGMETRLRTGSGGVRWVRLSLKPVSRAKEESSLSLAVFQDITTYKEYERELARRQELLSGVLNAVPQHIAVLDESGNIIQVNRTWLTFAEQNDGCMDLLGVGVNYLDVAKKVVGASESDQEEARMAVEGIKGVLSGELHSFTMEYPCHSERENRWFVMSVTPFEPSPEALGAVISHTNITERKQAEEALRHRSFELEVINKLTRKFSFTLNYEKLLELMLTNVHFALDYDAALGVVYRSGRLEISCKCKRPLSARGKREVYEMVRRETERIHGQDIGTAAVVENSFACLDKQDPQQDAIDGLGAHVFLPVAAGEPPEVVALMLGAERSEAFSSEQVDLLRTIIEQSTESLEQLQKLLEEEKRGLTQLVEAMPAGVLLLNADLSIEVANAKAHHLLQDLAGANGASSFISIVGTGLEETFRELDQDIGAQELAGLQSGGIIEVWAAPLEYGPYAGGWAMLLRDVTEERQQAENLRKSEEKFRMLFDASADAIFVHNLHGTFLDVNDEACRRLGYSRNELLTMTPKDLDSPEYVHNIPAHIEQIEQAKTIVFETEHMTRDGIRIPTEITARLIEYDGHIAAISTARDISERKRAAEAVREREQLFRSLVLGIKAAFFIVNRQTLRITDANAIGLELIGMAKKEVVGKPCGEVLAFDGFDHVCVGGTQSAEIRGEEHTLETAGGRRVEVSLSVLNVAIKGIPYFICLCFDISEQKRLERQLSLKHKLESVGRLAAGIAHEVNTPVQLISNNLEFLKEAFEHLHSVVTSYEGMVQRVADGADPAEAVRDIANARDEEQLRFYLGQALPAIEETQDGAEQISSIVASMKRFSHPGLPERTPLDVHEAVTNTVTVSRNEWKYNAQMDLDLTPDMPVVYGFPAEFNQALLNLIVNAGHSLRERYGESEEKGRIRITTQVEPENAVVIVEDDGMGIPASVQDRIFDPFFTTKEVGQGSGQGLAIVHAIIVEKHGGKVEVESEEGRGTQFIVRLPLARDAT